MAGLVPAIHDFVGAMQPLQCLREAYSLVLQRQRLNPIRQHLTAGPCIVATGTRAPTARLAAETPQLKQLRRALQVRLGRHDPLRGASCVRALRLYLALPARVMARRKARSFYGDTSVSERAGTFRRAVKRRLCDAGPRFQVLYCAQAGRRPVAQTKSFQPAPGRDSYWSRAEPRHRPSAELRVRPAGAAASSSFDVTPREATLGGQGREQDRAGFAGGNSEGITQRVVAGLVSAWRKPVSSLCFARFARARFRLPPE